MLKATHVYVYPTACHSVYRQPRDIQTNMNVDDIVQRLQEAQIAPKAKAKAKAAAGGRDVRAFRKKASLT